MKPWANSISVGDRFVKVGEPSRLIYEVASIVEPFDVLPHVRLTVVGRSGDMLMSVSAMLDKAFWSRVSSAPDQGAD